MNPYHPFSGVIKMFDPFLISVGALIGTVLIAYIVHSTHYPQVTGEFHTAGQTWTYRVGRIPFWNAGRFYFWMYQSWRKIPRDQVNGLLKLSQNKLQYTHKPLWQHMVDCGLNYPAIFFYLWWALYHLDKGNIPWPTI